MTAVIVSFCWQCAALTIIVNLTVIYNCLLMQDPWRPGVRDSVRLSQAAGIKVYFCILLNFYGSNKCSGLTIELRI